MWYMNPWQPDWAGDRCRRGSARLVDLDCANVDGTCCRRLAVLLAASVVGEASEVARLGPW